MDDDDGAIGAEPLRFRGNSASLKALWPPGEHPLHPEVVLSFPPGLELMTDASLARWVEEALLARPFASVGALVPDAFEAYARVLHPAYIGRHPDGERVTWATVASWTGRLAHPLMQFARIAELSDDPNVQFDWGTRPEDGSIPDDVIAPLVRVLKGFTASPERCYFGLWDGFGGLDLIPNFTSLPRIRAPGREYLLFRGGIEVMTSRTDDPQSGWPDDPQLWWPHDRSWCVATDIDLDSTYVGGSRACIVRLLAEPDLEVVPAGIEDRVDLGADVVNGVD